MQLCPTCNRTYPNDAPAFCPTDGTRLVNDAPVSNSQPTIASPAYTNAPQQYSTPQAYVIIAPMQSQREHALGSTSFGSFLKFLLKITIIGRFINADTAGTTYLITVDGREYPVNMQTYYQLRPGQMVEVHLEPQSGRVLGVYPAKAGSGQTQGNVGNAPSSPVSAPTYAPATAQSYNPTSPYNPAFVAPTKNRKWIILLVGLLVFSSIAALMFFYPSGSKPPAATSTPTRMSAPPTTSTPSVPSEVKVVRNKMGMELVYVPAGTFMMGSDKYLHTKPMHQVTISKGFYIGKYEVTQAQWKSVVGFNLSEFEGCDQCPVEKVTWDDAQDFVKKLNEQNDGYTYSLPSEAQWEYACRAGTTEDHPRDLDSIAWYEKNSGSKTHPVGQKQPNAWGLYDMYGNVEEWCEDIWHEDYDGAPTDGTAWLSGGDSRYRTLRGGSWLSSADVLDPALRLKNDPTYRHDYTFGFRLVAVARR